MWGVVVVVVEEVEGAAGVGDRGGGEGGKRAGEGSGSARERRIESVVLRPTPPLQEPS